MMTLLDLVRQHPAAVQLAGWACLLGYGAGLLTLLALGWRRLTKPDDGTVRVLRMALDDANARVVVLRHQCDTLIAECQGRQATIHDLTAQVTQLYRDADRLARIYVEREGARLEARRHTEGAA